MVLHTNVLARFSRFILVSTMLLCAALAHGQMSSPAGPISETQLQILQQMSPQDREQVLRSVVETSSGGLQDQQLSFPQVVQPLGSTNPGDAPAGRQLFDILGNPVLDDERRPIYLTDEFLDALDTQKPEDWLASETPFFEQEIILKPFGYGLFAGVPTTFAPATDIPVPPEYRLGPGDTIDVQLFGKENRQYSLVVSRDGTINFPNIGPVNVMGETFQDLKQRILDRVASQLIGTSAAVNMGALRSIQVLVLGDARRPGSYTVSGLSTITNALFVSGGITEIGSLRNIQLKRNGEVISTIDLYDLLLNGNSSDDVRLSSGDVIFIPPVGPTVGVGGFVKRPAIYELKSEKTAQQAIKLAGGLRADALPQFSRLERRSAGGIREFINIDLTTQGGLTQTLQFGDTLLIPPVALAETGGVTLLGHVIRPGESPWRPGMKLTDLISRLDLLKAQADLHYVLIRRVSFPTKRIEVLSADLSAALTNPASAANVTLNARDQVSVFPLEVAVADDSQLAALESATSSVNIAAAITPTATAPAAAPAAAAPPSGPTTTGLLNGAAPQNVLPASAANSELRTFGSARQQEVVETRVTPRRARVDELLTELLKQSSVEKPFKRVTVSGDVSEPGDYPYEPGMRVSDLVRAGGGLSESAYAIYAELARYTTVDGSERRADIRTIDLSKALAGDPEHNLVLLPQDFLSVRRMANWNNELSVTVRGEVRYPGRYAFKQGDTLSDLIARAGGLTDEAFPEGSLFLRQDLKEREQAQLDSLRERLAGDLALLSLRTAGSIEGGASTVETQSAGRALLADLNNAEAVGRLVIDLPQMLSNPDNRSVQVILKDQDELLIPDKTQEVTIIGEVNFPTSHVYARNLSRDNYIDKSGGVSPAGARKNIYVVKANGAVIASGSRFFSRSQRIDPGDTIVVPLDTETGFRLRAVASATSIVFNLAIAAAAIAGINN